MQQVLQCDLDVVWLRDPFPLFAAHPHLAAADVLVTANSGVSLIAATLSRAVLLVGSNHDYIRQSDGLPNRVSCDVATGACDRRAFAAGWRRAVESKCARRGAAQPVDRGAAVGWDGLCS